MPIHYSNPQCDVCGTRHAAGHVMECLDQLASLVAEVKAILEDAPELNMANLTDFEVAKLNDAASDAYSLLLSFPSPVPRD